MTGPVHLPPSSYVPYLYFVTDERVGLIAFILVVAIAVCFLLMSDRDGNSLL